MLMPTRWLANEGQPPAAAPRRVTEADLDRMESERESAVSAYLAQRRASTCCDHACDQGRTCPQVLAPHQAAAAATEVGSEDDDDKCRALSGEQAAGLVLIVLSGCTLWGWAVYTLIGLITRLA